MRNKVKRIAALSAALLMLAVSISITALAEQAANSPKAGDDRADASAQAAASYRKAAENDNLILYVNEATLGIQVENKHNGYVWNGTLNEKDEKLNQTWQRFFESGVTVEYMDDKRKVRMAPLTGEQADVGIAPAADGFTAEVNYGKLGISLQVEVKLTEDAVEFRVPEASIRESGDKNRLQSLYMYPFFGASKGVQPGKGYMLIPDGSGSLISLNEQTIATQPYIGRVYGNDHGMKGGIPSTDELMALPPEQIHLPAFGMARQEGENAFVSLITGGAPYAEILSYPSGVTTSYNWTTAKWIYREPYFQPVDKKGKGVNLNQETKNSFDSSMKLMLLSGDKADYSGMAGRVRGELVERGELPSTLRNEKDSLPLRIEFLAADKQKQMIGSSVIPMTTVRGMEDILDDLRASEVDRMMVVVRGWTKGGATGASPSHFPVEDKVASGGEWKKFTEKYGALRIPVYFYTDYTIADKSADGYGKGDIAQSIAKQLLPVYDYAYFLKPYVSKKLFEDEIPSFRKNGMSRLAVDSIGSQLYSDFGDNALTRSQALETYQTMLSQDSVEGFALYKANQYLWKYADRILDLPMQSSSFLLETEEIPFLQLVLKGYVDYYAPASNFNANPREELLKRIDYGSYPSFILTDEDPFKLGNTGSRWLYTSQYANWKDRIVEEYRTVAGALEPVRSAAFEKREELREGVFRNRYSNGTAIYVNYTLNEVTVDGNKVPAQGFLVREGDRS